MYAVESADAGPLGVVSGEALMEDGLVVQPSDASLGHVFFLEAVDPIDPVQ
jgi:hypothetical protein